MEPCTGRYVSTPEIQTVFMAKQVRQGKSRQRAEKGSRRRQQHLAMPFHARNYALMTAGLVVITIGYVIMALEQEVDGFLSLYVSPILLIAGYLEIIYAIVWRPKVSATDPQ
ncbi:DUF3098 domain-containing protein [Bacteroidota bacterium]